jgi:sortase B
MSNKKRAGPIIIKTVGVVAGLALVISGAYFIIYTGQAKSNQKTNSLLAQIMWEDTGQTQQGEGTQATGARSEQEDKSAILPGMAKLLALNQEVCGWLSVPGCQIDYPVLKHSDNSYYLKHDFNGEKSRFGAVFADCTLNTESGSKDNVALYGHAMANGTMFGQLYKYRDLGFANENSSFSYTDLHTQHTAQVFAVIITNAQAAQDNGSFFEWRQSGFADEDEFSEWLAEVMKRSLYVGAQEPEYTDRIISLTTCAFDFKDARLVVLAKLTEEGQPAGVLSSNPQPLFPQAWYDRYGGSKPV